MVPAKALKDFMNNGPTGERVISRGGAITYFVLYGTCSAFKALKADDAKNAISDEKAPPSNKPTSNNEDKKGSDMPKADYAKTSSSTTRRLPRTN